MARWFAAEHVGIDVALALEKLPAVTAVTPETIKKAAKVRRRI
jgi:hypothetical protein